MKLVLWKSCEDIAIMWLSGGHHDIMALIILKNSKKIGKFGMECAIAERSGNYQQTHHKNEHNFEHPCKSQCMDFLLM